MAQRLHARQSRPLGLPAGADHAIRPAWRVPITSASCSRCTCATRGSASIGPVFLTGGPRLGATTTFYWDQSEWPRTAALLEPVGLRAVDPGGARAAVRRLALLRHPQPAARSATTTLPTTTRCSGSSSRTSPSRATRAILDETAGAFSVIDHLRRLAYRPRTQHVTFGDRVLVDLGRDAWELLECVPNYRDAVVSFNAGYVGMLRSLTELLRAARTRRRSRSGGRRRRSARRARCSASTPATAAGGSRTRRATTSSGTASTSSSVAAAMAEDLTAEQRDEMVAFVTGLAHRRQLDARARPEGPDRAVLRPPRPRSGGSLRGAGRGRPRTDSSRLGRRRSRRRLPRSGARESFRGALGSGRRARRRRQVRVAERGVSNRDSNAAVAVTEAVIAGLFGIRADFGTLEVVEGSTESPYGSLHGVRAVGFDLASEPLVRQPVGGSRGLTIRPRSVGR